MKPNHPSMENDYQFKKECDQIELITGKKWQWVVNNYTLPELIGLQGARLIFDFF